MMNILIVILLIFFPKFCEAAENKNIKLKSNTSEIRKNSLLSSFYEVPSILGPTVQLIRENTGLTIKGCYRGFFYGNIAGGKKSGAAWDQEMRLTGIYDFGFLNKTLEGLTLTGDVRWREGKNPNTFVGTVDAFQPSGIEVGKYFRALRIYLTYSTPSLFGVKNFLTISGGWQNPFDTFLQQPTSQIFVNNIFGVKGMGANIPWGSTYAAWGGYIKFNPTDWYYAQAGLYMAIPEAGANHNHGFNFQGSIMPGKPNGLYAVAETGFTPKIGPALLAGKYAFGSYWFGVHNKAWDGTSQQGQYGFYWQADQQLYRASRDISSDKGLYSFSLFTYAPPYNNRLSFYFQTGLVYQGLIPRRDRDRLGLAFGYGNYSNQFSEINRSKKLPHATSQAVLEIDYDIVITKWCSFRPFYQLLINPAGNSTLRNAHILGFGVTASF